MKTYLNSNPEVATVENGILIARSPGTTTITEIEDDEEPKVQRITVC